MISNFNKGFVSCFVCHCKSGEYLIKNFDLKRSTFKGKGARSIVYIYEDEVMVGLVLPILVKN